MQQIHLHRLDPVRIVEATRTGEALLHCTHLLIWLIDHVVNVEFWDSDVGVHLNRMDGNDDVPWIKLKFYLGERDFLCSPAKRAVRLLIVVTLID